MLPFPVHFEPGSSRSEQLVYAVKKAVISGRMRPGDAFPSVRVLSRELKINPNTAHKVVTQLIAEGLLETVPGIGTIVAAVPESTHRERARLLGRQIEQLAVEARKLNIPLEDVLEALTEHWQNLTPTAERNKQGERQR